MTVPKQRAGHEAARRGAAALTPADATIPAEEALEDAETAREARDEAERLGAVPYELFKITKTR